MNLNKTKKIYFIGIGGIMMSAVARYFKAQGKEVLGSNRDNSELLEKLKTEGISVFLNHDEKNITPDVDLVIYTVAIPDDNPEMQKAKKLNLPIFSVYEILGKISENKKMIAVSGMHGKSTITSMLGLVAQKANLKPTVFVGTQVKEWQGNFLAGDSDLMISEACEYRDNFFSYHPDILIINNLEPEHLDYFKTFANIQKSFWQLISQIKPGGKIIYNADDENVIDLLKNVNQEKFSYALKNPNVDLLATKIIEDETGVQFTTQSKFSELNNLSIKLKVSGKFNVLNALGVLLTAKVLQIEISLAVKSLENFTGIWRRFEFLGEKNGVLFYDDYAHHPTEIKATLSAVQSKFKNRKVWLIFQPHLFSRTKEFLNDFAQALSSAENLIITDIYAAREKEDASISSQDLVDKINLQKRQNPAIYLDNFDKIEEYLISHVQANNVIITMGAGDVYEIIDLIKKEI
jgi:UDP-N-acetylmuramate--alanine ligase